MEINPVIIVIGMFFLIVFATLIPSKKARKLKKVFGKPISKLTPSLNGQYARVQGKVTAINTIKTPIFNHDAVICEAGVYTLSEREKRDPDFYSHEGNWILKKSELQMNDFLLEDNGWYALIKTSGAKEILTKTKNDINAYDIGFISTLNKGKVNFEDITDELKNFMESLGMARLTINNFFNYEVLRAKEQLLLDGDFVSVVGKCKVDDVKNYPEIKNLVHPMTSKILVIEQDEKELYVTDDMKTLYG